jgi:hypothetical protein
LNELLSQIRMRQSAFTPAERMVERYNIEPNVLDDLKQVNTSHKLYWTIIFKHFVFFLGFKVTTGRNGSINEYFERRFSGLSGF